MPEITHDIEHSRFECVADGLRSECVYRMVDGVMVFTHTEVPRALEGRGIAAALVREALAWARAQGLRVRPRCSYVAAYMRRHPEAADLLQPS